MKNRPKTVKNKNCNHDTQTWNHENWPGTIINQPETMKNFENRPETMKNHEN